MVQREMEYDATASGSIQDEVGAELTRARQTSDEDSAAAAAALKKAKTAMASGEEAEKQAVKADTAANESNLKSMLLYSDRRTW